MPIPSGVETVTVSSGEPMTTPDGSFMRGHIRFVAPPLAVAPSDDYTFGGEAVAELVDGEFSIVLVAPDATGINPTGWTYTVIGEFTNAPDWETFIDISKDDPSVVFSDVVETAGTDPSFATIFVRKDGDTMTGPLILAGDPDLELEAATKQFVDNKDAQNVKLTGNQTVAGIKTFTSIPVGPAANPTDANQLARKAYVDLTQAEVDNLETEVANLDAQNVKITGDQTVNGVKTFGSIPVLPGSDPVAANEAVRKAYVDALDAQNVKITGVQSVAGAKTFTDPFKVQSALDTNLLTVQQDNTGANAGVMRLVAGHSAQQAFLGTFQGAAANSWAIRADGRFEVGSGAGARDALIARAGVGVFEVTNQIRALGATPLTAADLTRKDYVDTADNLRLLKANNLSDLVDAGDARDNLGLGNSAVLDVGMVQNTVADGEALGYNSGIILGGELSVNGSNPLHLDIGATVGFVVDYTTNPSAPTIVRVSTSPQTIPLADTVNPITWWLMDQTGVVTQQSTRPTNTQRRTHLQLGATVQTGGVAIIIDQSLPVSLAQPVNQLYDLMYALGSFSIEGNQLATNGANLTFSKTAGTVFAPSFNRFAGSTLTKDPHVSPIAAQAPVQLRYILRSTNPVPPTQTNINPGLYDVANVATAIPGGANTSTIQRVYAFPLNATADQIVIQYGQNLYSSLDLAVAAIQTETHIVNPTARDNGILLGFIVVTKSATDLTNPSHARFVQAAKFSSGSAGSGVADLSGFALLSGANFTGLVSGTLASAITVANSSLVTGDTFDRFRRFADGAMEWGSGTGARDVSLSRSSADNMTSPDTWNFGEATLGTTANVVNRQTAMKASTFIAQSDFRVAHRGSGDEFPEHTLAAYESAVAAGATAIEVSCQLTADGVLVAFHDTDLERMTGVTGSSIGAMTYAALREQVRVNAKGYLGDGWSLQEVPTVREVLDRFFGRVVIFIEPKTNPAVTPLQNLLTGGSYPRANQTVVWKVHYTSPSKTWAITNGFLVWSYIDTGTTAAQMDAVDAQTTFWGVPIEATDAKITEVVSRPGGKPVMVWAIRRRYDYDRVHALGVKGKMTSNWLYNYNNPVLPASRWELHKTVEPGTLGRVKENANYALHYDANGRAYIPAAVLPNNAVLMGGRAASIAQAAGTYKISYTMTWDTIPGSNLHSGIAFAKPDDREYIFSAANVSGGYHVVFRNTGQLQLYRHDAGNPTGVLLANLATTSTPSPGVPMTFEVDVTPTTVSVTRTDSGGPYTVSSNDTTYRGRYWHLSAGSVALDAEKPFWEDVNLA
ncbi:hypothetical protein SEA_YARA_27 [Streptomyces phage Yara]|nr:hypothetical protein SEA_YARA_27 [Streptomyces phage Yara]